MRVLIVIYATNSCTFELHVSKSVDYWRFSLLCQSAANDNNTC